jgi:hypothetical protein
MMTAMMTLRENLPRAVVCEKPSRECCLMHRAKAMLIKLIF